MERGLVLVAGNGKRRYSSGHDHFSSTIAACAKGGEWKEAVSLINKAIQENIYKKELGLDGSDLDFHISKIYREEIKEKHIPGVPLSLAKVILHKVLSENDIKTLNLIVGYHGDQQALKNGIIEYVGKDLNKFEITEDAKNKGMLLLKRLH